MKIKYIHITMTFVLVAFVLLSVNCKINPDLSAVEVEQSVFQKVNEYRLSIQLGQLAWQDVIAQQCRNHSDNMAAGKTAVGHEGYEERFDNIETYLPGAIFLGENVVYVSGHPDPAEYALDLWLSKPTHKANIENNFDLTGVGAAIGGDGSFYITQIFVRIK
jgi:uncharacterized protein YkwD